MSNIKNSLILTKNAGTAKSGWWNPDHAARASANKALKAADSWNKRWTNGDANTAGVETFKAIASLANTYKAVYSK